MRLLMWATLVMICTTIYAQQTAQIDFFADGGSFETDHDKDGRADYISSYFDGSLDAASIVLSLDYQNPYRGTASQRVQLMRNNGGRGRFVLLQAVRFDGLIKPEVGEPILVRVALRAEAFQNASYRLFVRTGSREVELLPSTNQAISEWRVFATVVPVEPESSGAPHFSLNLEIRVQEGAAQGRVWLDEAQAISTRTIMRRNRLPNQLQVALTYLYSETNGYHYLDKPISFVIGQRRAALVLERHFTQVQSAPYVYFAATVPSASARHSTDLYNYEDVEQNHPDWFLTRPDGSRITLDGTFYLDIRRTEVRERAWQSLRDFLSRTRRPRHVMQDNVDMLVVSREGPINNYPNNDAWVQAVVGWYEYVGSRLRNEFNAGFIPNVAWAPGFWLRGIAGYPDAPGAVTLPYINGFFIEHAFMRAKSDRTYSIPSYGTATGIDSPASWDRRRMRDTIRLATEYPDKIVILVPTIWLGQADTSQRIRFAVAGFLVLQHDNTFVQLDPRYQRNEPEYHTGFYPPEMLVPLGRWTENYRILQGDLITGGLFVRNYEYGIVVWNPTHDRTFSFTIPRDLYNWDRELVSAGTVIQVPPRTGHVFYSAPEITLEISPQNAQVLPGQTVQFTVTYRNRGTAPGTNVRVAVPLPQGMTLVGSNPTARLENGQVVWVVPNVPVGGQGTLQFTVRVE